jgi:hypothetical protein
VRYICVIHLKNAGSLQDDFWCLFLNIWLIFVILLVNGSNWILPGIYTPTYEICSCISQNYGQTRKFENTAMALSLTTMIIFSFVAIRIHTFKYKLKMTVAPVGPIQNHKSKFQNKLLADLTLTICSVLLIATTFAITYIIGSTHVTVVDFNIIQCLYLLMMPVAFNLVTILFYAKNVNARKMILRELRTSLMHCNQ